MDSLLDHVYLAIKEVEERLEKNRELLERVYWLLGEIEWAEEQTICPICKMVKISGHQSDCEFSEVMQALRVALGWTPRGS
jgi:hypothetical protein